jgi:hypothetical protein
MKTKVAAVMLALAMVLSASMVWAGNGQQSHARKAKCVAAGTCRMQQAPGQMQLRVGQLQGNRFGPGDGTGNMGDGPKDGTGYGRKSGLRTGTGTCDGTGPHGTVRRTGGPGHRR